MGIWTVMILTITGGYIYAWSVNKLIHFYQHIGLIDSKYLFDIGDGNQYNYEASSYIWSLIILLALATGFTFLYYRKNGKYFWENIL